MIALSRGQNFARGTTFVSIMVLEIGKEGSRLFTLLNFSKRGGAYLFPLMVQGNSFYAILSSGEQILYFVQGSTGGRGLIFPFLGDRLVNFVHVVSRSYSIHNGRHPVLKTAVHVM